MKFSEKEGADVGNCLDYGYSRRSPPGKCIFCPTEPEVSYLSMSRRLRAILNDSVDMSRREICR